MAFKSPYISFEKSYLNKLQLLIKNQKNKGNFSVHNVINRQILEKKSYKTFILLFAVSITKYTKTHIHKTQMIYMQKNSLHIPFTSGFKYHKISLEFGICTKHSLKLNTNFPSLPKSPTKTVILYSSKVTGAEVVLYSTLEWAAKNPQDFWKKRPQWL